MRISFSNIAWDIKDDEKIATLLQEYHVDAIDIAPMKYFPAEEPFPSEQIKNVKAWWNQRNINMVGMQSLLFGTTGLNVFGDWESQQSLLNHMRLICRMANESDAKRLVFGSPKNRDRSTIESDAKVQEQAIKFFQKLGDIAKEFNALICLEPNPKHYGCNFMTNHKETAEFVKSLNHSAIKMQLDTGAVTLNSEDISSILENHSDLIGHIHISEPDLLPIGGKHSNMTDHAQIGPLIKQALPDNIATIEMRAPSGDEPLITLQRALETAKKYYE